jgi:RecA/RadA recombinase
MAIAKKAETKVDAKEENTGENIPSRKKLEKKTFSLSDFKTKLKVEDTNIKDLTWLPLSKAFQEATSLEGVPIGELTLIRGYSDTSKSSIMYEAMVSAQNNGFLPIIIDTENAMKREYLTNLGFDFDGDYIYVDSDYLVTNYGKKFNKDFSVPSIEDVAEFINDMLDKQESGDLPMDYS